jgi:hypothetical protein
MGHVFDTNDIRTTGMTVEGRTVLSGNTGAPILVVTGTSGTNFQVIEDPESDLLWSLSASTGAVFEVYTDRVESSVPINSSGNTIVSGNQTITGTLVAESKSFDIPHPTKEGYRLRYGVLEGPEHGVYFRGKNTDGFIKLPEYWKGLVHEDSITVHLTPIKEGTTHFVVDVRDNEIEIDSVNGYINTYFIVHAERKYVEKVLHEYKID